MNSFTKTRRLEDCKTDEMTEVTEMTEVKKREMD